MIVNKAKLAEILGISERTLTAWQEQGLPVSAYGGKPGKANHYNTHEVIKWWIARETGDDLNAEKTRLTREQADKTAIENARLRRELIPTATAQAQAERVFGAVRARILALPVKFAPQILGLKEMAEIRAMLDRGVRECLTELASLELRDDGTVVQRGTESVHAGAASDTEPVGGRIQKAKPRNKRSPHRSRSV